MNNLVMVLVGGMWMMGCLDERRLLKPQGYSLVQTSNGQFQHRLNKLPGDPPFGNLPKDFFYYPVKDKVIEGLYVEATTGIKMVAVVPPGMQ